MSSGMDLRKRMVRREPPKRGGGKAKANPSPLGHRRRLPGEVRSPTTTSTRSTTCTTSPSIQARDHPDEPAPQPGCARRDGATP